MNLKYMKNINNNFIYFKYEKYLNFFVNKNMLYLIKGL